MKKIWKLENEEQFYNDLLQISKDEIHSFISSTEKNSYYQDIVKIEKKSGFREICRINKSSVLFYLQQQLKNNFLNNISISDVSHGFVKDHNYYDFLVPHINFYNNSFFLRLDIADFFGSIKYDHINNVMSYYFLDSFDKDLKEEVLFIIGEILTFQDKVIQGTPTAPVISNIIFRSLDIRIQRYCQKFGVIYSRYVDDLLFSADKNIVHSSSFIKGIQNIIISKNFKLNYMKTMRTKDSISLNGYVIDNTIRLSRKKLKRLNRVLFYLETVKFKNNSEWFKKFNDEQKRYEPDKEIKSLSSKNELVNFLAGNRSFLISSLRYSDNQSYRKRCTKMIANIEKQIKNIL